MFSWFFTDWGPWLVATIVVAPLVRLWLTRWAPADLPSPDPASGGALALIGLGVFAAVQPAFISGGRPLAEAMLLARYWYMLGVLKIVAAALGLIAAHRVSGDRDPLGLGRTRFVRYVLWGIGLYLLSMPLLKVVTSIIDDSGHLQKPAQVLLDAESGRLRHAMAFCLVFATPVCEEIAFRGLLQGGMRRLVSRGPAVIASAVLFTVVHEPRALWFSIFLLALVLGWIYEKTRSLWPGIIVHFIHNLLVFIQLTIESRSG